ncbi:MAG: amino acid permease, partial [Candidatus Nealsonbacteria bacterium]|nr:amino acid permease [Candidatus Nealsonbacteria bacterium]
GGDYNVAKENLGKNAALIGGASLWVDYILTTAVSVAAGVAAITSAFPMLYHARVIIGVVIIIGLMWTNLRGLRESGKLFSFPTYIFIASFAVMIIYGIFRFISGDFIETTEQSAVATGSLGMLSFALILHAFSAGCTALTGIEATSNGVQTFKAPESKNAAKTLIRLALILGLIFFGITILAYWVGISPSENETVVSQIARAIFGKGPFYYFIQAITALILILAANTPFAGFPQITSQQAKDGYFPRQFYNLGSRLVFNNGIIALSIAASLLIIFFEGSVHALIPLYAVGVFLGFSISQLGMIAHWKRSGRGHAKKMAINALGFLATSVVFIVVFFSKFTGGAWVLIPGIILIIMIMKKIKKHYSGLEKTLALESLPREPMHGKTTVVWFPSLTVLFWNQCVLPNRSIPPD